MKDLVITAGKNRLLKKILLTMKLITFFLMFCLVSVTASTYSQNTRLDITLENGTIVDLIQQIEENSEFYFYYQKGELKELDPITLRASNATIGEILDKALEGTNFDYSVLDRYIVIRKDGDPAGEDLSSAQGEARAQQQAVTGTVTDAQGQPLPGVTVMVKGTTQGTVTNERGEFRLTGVPENSTLVFSFVGMKTQEMEVGTQTSINMSMTEESIGLEEVVAVGYGTQRAGEITGSVSTADVEQLARIPTGQTSAALKGLMSGVTITNSHKPGDNAVIRIRGLGTINNNDPLWVVDGVPGASVPPEEIESISVLKDASSQAIYGARAANGVILVTTKSGRKNQKARVKVTTRTGFVQNTTDFGLLNTQEYGEYLWLRAKNSGIEGYSHALYGNGPTPDIPEYILPARASNVDLSLYDNLMLHEDGTDTYLIMKANREGTDWLSEISRNAAFHQYGVEVAGGSEFTNYAFIGNYIKNEGVFKHTSYERFNLRSNITSNLTSWLEIGQRLGASVSIDRGRQTDHGEGSVISFTYRMQPIVPVYDVMGNFAGSRAPETGNSQSPAFILHAGQNDYRKNLDVNGNYYAKITFLKNFSVQSLFGFALNSFGSKQFNMVEVATSERGTYDQLSQNKSFRQQWNWTNTVQYQNSFNSHNLDILAGTEAVSNENDFLGGARSQFFFKTPLYMQLNVGERDITNNGSMSDWSLFSQFGRINYNYAHKYMLQATIRRDGSSRFGGENRYGVFPAFSAGWGISEEAFMASTKSWLDNLRLRAGWGRTGNDQIGNYNGFTTYASSPMQSYYPVSGSNTSATSGFYANAIGNLGARWETTTTTNIGIDAVLFRNFSIAIDLWNRNTEDMLYNKQIPNVLGTASPPAINVGDMKNQGIDLNLRYQGDALADELKYDISLNFSHYRNEIINLSGTEDEFIEGGELRGHSYTRAETGTAFPVFYGFIVDGIFQNEEEAANHPTTFGEAGTYNKPGHFKYRNMNDDNVINDEDRTIIGSPHPDFTAGLNTHLEYKGFTVSAFLYSSYGNEIVNQPRRFIDFNLFSGNRSARSLYESWGSPYLSDNSKATMPIVELDDAGSQYPSTYYVEDGSYIRLENLMLGYNFSDLLGAQNNFHLYFQVTNLFTITKYSGLDPEIGRGGMSAGVDAGAWPAPRQYLFGVNIDF